MIDFDSRVVISQSFTNKVPELEQAIRKMAAGGTSIVVSSHVMDEAERCDRLGLIRFGKLLAEGTVAEIKVKAGVDRLEDAFLKLSESPA